MNGKIKKFAALLLGAALLGSCTDMGTNPVHNVASPTSTTIPVPITGAVSFSAQVEPIFQAHRCTSCHGGSGGLVLTSYASVMAGGNHGAILIPGNAPGSNIILKLTQSPPPFGSRMPLGGPYLADSLVQVIGAWINQGALNN